MKELLNKVDKILEKKIPDKKDRDDLLAKAGEIIILETLDDVLFMFPGDRERQKFSDLIKNGDIGNAFDYAEDFGIKVDDVFESKSTSLVKEIFG